MSIHAVETEAEHARTDQDENHERGELGGGIHRLLQQFQTQASAHDCHDECSRCAHRAAFGWRGNTKEDGAKHQEDQRQRRDQYEYHLLGESGQKSELECAIGECGNERESNADRRGHDDGFVERLAAVFLREDHGDGGGYCKQYRQRNHPATATCFLEYAGFCGQGGHPLRLDE